VDVTLRFNGVDLIYRLTKQFLAFDYLSDDEWEEEDIKSYDFSPAEITANILGYDKTKIVAKMVYHGSQTPTVDDIEWVIRLEPKDNGGRNVSTRFSSVIPMTSDTQFISFDTSNLVIKTMTGSGYLSEFFATLVIDNNLLPTFAEYDITARLYTLPSIDSSGCNVDGFIYEDDDCMIFEDGDDFMQENP
jgi:hypothetical protein